MNFSNPEQSAARTGTTIGAANIAILLAEQDKRAGTSIEERIDRLKMFAFKVVLRSFAMIGAYGLIAHYCALHVQVVEAGAKRALRSSDARDSRISVLVLDLERFRGDVDIFSRASDMRFLCISWTLLRYLLASYVYPPTENEQIDYTTALGFRWTFALAGPDTRIHVERERYRGFLRKFLPHLFRKLGIDVVMNSDHRYRREADLTRVAVELGYKHICYYREAMFLVPSLYAHAVERHKVFAPFRGSVIAVQNEIARQSFIDARMTESDKVVIRGCPRMDSFLERISNASVAPSHKQKTQQIAYFSSQPRRLTVDRSHYFDFFSTSQQVVKALVELARDNPDLKVVLKMKDQHSKGEGGGQIREFKEIVASVAGSLDALPNVTFETGRMAAQDIILSSDVICAMQSTVVLEAAIAGKPVILPHFKSLREQYGAEQMLMYQEHRDLFDVPDDAVALKDMVRRRLSDSRIDPAIMAKRNELFDKHVSPLTGKATETSLALIREFAADGGVAH